MVAVARQRPSRRGLTPGGAYVPERNLGDAERLASGAFGGAAVLWGARHGGLGGVLALLAGAALVGRGATGYCPVAARLGPNPGERHVAKKLGWSTAAAVTRSVTIAKPPGEVYRFFRDFRNLPRFMRHVKRIDVLDDKH